MDIHQGGPASVWLRKEAIADGYHDRAIARLVRQGDWHRVRRGAYTDASTWQELDAAQRHGLLARAVLKQACTEVVLSHVSALPEHAAPVWGLGLEVVHVTRPDRRAGRRERGVLQHIGILQPEDVVTRNGVPVTSPTRAALEVTTVAPLEACVVILDDLLHRGLTTAELLRSRYAGMGCWPRTLHTDLALRLMDARSESVGESRTRFLCWQHGLPPAVPQYPITDPEGRVVAYTDLAWPAYGVFLEFDGKVKYSTLLREGESPVDVVLREKRREDMICELTGWRCIRLVWADLHRPAATALRIRSVLGRGQHVA